MSDILRYIDFSLGEHADPARATAQSTARLANAGPDSGILLQPDRVALGVGEHRGLAPIHLRRPEKVRATAWTPFSRAATRPGSCGKKFAPEARRRIGGLADSPIRCLSRTRKYT